MSRVVGIRYSSTLAVTRSRHALTLYIPSSHTIHSLVRALSPSVCVCVCVRCRQWCASLPAACLAEGASEALARGFVPGLLLAFSPLLLPSNPWLYSIIIADAPAIRNLPTRRSLLASTSDRKVVADHFLLYHDLSRVC